MKFRINFLTECCLIINMEIGHINNLYKVENILVQRRYLRNSM